MKHRRLIFLALAVALLLAVSLPAAAQSQATTILYPQEPDSLNPMYTSMYFAGITFDLFLEGAWTFDDDLNPVPRMVTQIPSVENGGISEDGTVITLTLRDDLTWSDGAALTSADFLFTYEMITSDGNIPNTRYPYGPEEGIIESVEAPDATNVIVTFTEPFAPWWTTLFRFVLPEHVLRPVYEAEGTIDTAGWNRAPTVGFGPFVFAEWEIGSFVRFTRNENYIEDVNLDTVIVRFIPDSEAYVAALLNQEGDLGTFVSPSDITRLEDAGLEVIFVNSGYNEQWVLNVHPERGHPALQDVRVREALVLAFNRQQIAEDLLDPRFYYPPASFWEQTPFASPNVEVPPYDPERAAQLLDEAGWVVGDSGIREKDGVELRLRYISNQRQIRIDVMAVVQQAYEELGIAVDLVNYPADIFFNNYALGGPTAIGDYDISQYSTTSNFPDPNTSIFLCSQIPTDDRPEGGNYRGYCNEELDELFAEQARTADLEQRAAIFHQIDEHLAEQFLFVGVWYDADNWIINPRLSNLRLNGVTPFWNIYEWVTVE
jgi:peptide/nickel transport system substrate-binding protein